MQQGQNDATELDYRAFLANGFPIKHPLNME
jgi:hypothetical protein